MSLVPHVRFVRSWRLFGCGRRDIVGRRFRRPDVTGGLWGVSRGRGLNVRALLLDGLQDVEFDTAVLLATLRVFVFGDGFVRTVTFGTQTSLVDALVGQILHDGFGTFLRESAVLVCRTDVVGVASNFDQEDLFASLEDADDGVEDGEADGALDLVAACGEFDTLQDLDVVVGDFDEAHAFVRTTIFIVESVERFGLLRALVEVVREAVFVGVWSFVRTTVGVLESVDDFRHIRAFVGFVEDLVVVVVGLGAAIGVAEAVGVFSFFRTLILLVRDAVFVGIWTAVELLAAELAVLVGALVVGVGDVVLVAVGQDVGATIFVLEAVDGFLFVFALVLVVGDAVLIVVVIETSVVILEAVLIFGDGRTLVFLVVDPVVIFVAHFIDERDTADGAEERYAYALQDAATAADREGHGQTEGRDLRAAIDLERVCPVQIAEPSAAETFSKDPENRARLESNGRAVTKLERPDGRGAETCFGTILSTQVQGEAELAEIAVDDDSTTRGDGQAVADVLVRRGERSERSGDVDGATEHDGALLWIADEAELAFERCVTDTKCRESLRVRAARARVDAVSFDVHDGNTQTDLHERCGDERREHIDVEHVVDDVHVTRVRCIGLAAIRFRFAAFHDERLVRVVEQYTRSQTHHGVHAGAFDREVVLRSGRSVEPLNGKLPLLWRCRLGLLRICRRGHEQRTAESYEWQQPER